MPKTSKANHDRQSLANIGERINAVKISLDSLIRSMKLAKVDVLDISGQAEMLRGMKALEAFATNGQKRLQKILEEQGAFHAQNGTH